MDNDLDAAKRHCVVDTRDEPDTTDYASVREPETLFVPNAAYTGREVMRRIRCWMAANLDGRIIE